MRMSDWSSDVGSSDLPDPLAGGEEAGPVLLRVLAVDQESVAADVGDIGRRHAHPAPVQAVGQGGVQALFRSFVKERQQGALVVVVVVGLLFKVGEIGRAACRERVCKYV